ncbi:MAG TPA: hypothetical protein VFO76_04385 [Candidatus Kapabacteria bacterium]|nr:hypothetical protein [Candidatus Kapabacteria bacterium]
MKTYLLYLMAITITVFSGCSGSDNSVTPTPTGRYGDQSNAKISFWSTMEYTGGSISIKINGVYRGKFTKYVPSGGSAPDCDDPDNGSDVLSVILPAGTYSYYAETQDGQYYWQNEFTLTSGECLRYLLH